MLNDDDPRAVPGSISEQHTYAAVNDSLVP